MKKIYQTKFGDDGNCLAACISSILETDLANIPFISDFEDDWDAYYEALNRVLTSQFDLYLEYTDAETWESRFKPHFLDSYCIVSGPSSIDCLEHAVIYRNGEEVHNPNQNGTRMLEPSHYYFFLRRFR